jgi:hypothetical protein
MSFSRLGFHALPPKRRVFVSYHHDNDQGWYDLFQQWYSEVLALFTNRSLAEPVDSDQLDYVHRTIRERNITGTSITIVPLRCEDLDEEVCRLGDRIDALYGTCTPRHWAPDGRAESRRWGSRPGASPSELST